MDNKGHVFWFTGLSGAGKTTLSTLLRDNLQEQGQKAIVLDGDVIRHRLCKDLGFSAEDRTENVRRTSEVAALFADQGICVITAFISPYLEHRALAESIIGKERFHTIYIKASVDTCQKRDPKGLYKQALSGQIKQFTGISDRFDEPLRPNLVVDTNCHTIEESSRLLCEYVGEVLAKSLVLSF